MWTAATVVDGPIASFQGKGTLLWRAGRYGRTGLDHATLARIAGVQCLRTSVSHFPRVEPAQAQRDHAAVGRGHDMSALGGPASRGFEARRTCVGLYVGAYNSVWPLRHVGSYGATQPASDYAGLRRLASSGQGDKRFLEPRGSTTGAYDSRASWEGEHGGHHGDYRYGRTVRCRETGGHGFYGTTSLLAGCPPHWQGGVTARLYGYTGVHATPGLARRGFSFFGGGGKKDTGSSGVAQRRTEVASGPTGLAVFRNIISLTFGMVKWVVVLPFRLSKATLHLFSLTFKTMAKLMRLFARAAVVARVSGVSGIFKSLIDGVKHTVHWCKTGFRLYFANVKVSYYILLKRLKGHPMRYHERKLLMKTLNDALKMLPFSFFIIVPFAEFLLPVAIRLFPQMLPSTFRTDNPKSDDYLQKKLLAKKELAQFFQELVQERTNQILQEELDSSLKTKMAALKDFQERILNKEDLDVNPFLSSNELLVFSKLFKKEFKLDQMNLETLKVMCKLLGITPFSMRTHVMLQLRHHLLKIQREDRLIMWEGVESLTTEELQEACRDRAMKFYNVTKEQMQQQLKQWLDLSSMPEISPILLLWSRCITMTHEPMAIKPDDDVKDEAEPIKAATAAGYPGDMDKADQDAVKPAKVAEKFAEEVTTAQKASSRRLVQAVTAAAEVDAQKLLNKEERLEELSLKAKELKDIIEGNIAQPDDETIRDSATPFDDKAEELMIEIQTNEDKFMNLTQGDHVIRHTPEITKLSQMGKQEILARHEELLSALQLQRQISDLQHHQLTEMFMFLLKVSEEMNAGRPFDFAENMNQLVNATRSEMEKIEGLTYQFDKHNLTYD